MPKTDCNLGFVFFTDEDVAMIFKYALWRCRPTNWDSAERIGIQPRTPRAQT